MSKLIQKLRQASTGAGPPIGFRSSTAPKVRPMLLVVALPLGDIGISADIGDVRIDGMVTHVEGIKRGDQVLQRIAGVAGETPWGIGLNRTDEKVLGQLRGAGCDFLFLEAEATSAALLQEEELGKVVKVDPLWGDSLVRSIEQLAIDAVLVEGGEDAPDIYHLMHCQRLASLVRKPLLLITSLELTERDVHSLWQASVSGIVVRVAGEQSKRKLLKLSQAIEALPSRRKRPREAEGVLLPSLGQDAELSEEI